MTRPSTLNLWAAETRKLLTRSSARLGLVLAIAVGVLGPMLLRFFSDTEFELNGAPTAMATFLFPRAEHDATGGQFVTLRLRNQLLFPLLLMWLAAASCAGEYRSGTLREDLLRPVSRSQVLLAKWGALLSWIALSLALSWVVSAATGALLFGLEGHWLALISGYGSSLASDAMLAALTLLVALICRSVPGTLVGMFLAWVVGVLSGFALNVASALLSVDHEPARWIEALNPWLPNQAAFAWIGCAPSEAWVGPHFGSIALTTAVCLFLGAWIFRRLDVP